MTLERKSLDDVHPRNKIPRHSLLAHTARGHYEAALILAEVNEQSIQSNTGRGINVWPSIILLMEQSIEMLLKALLLANDSTTNVRKYGHQLTKILKTYERSSPNLQN